MIFVALPGTANVALAIKQPQFINPKDMQGFDWSFESGPDLIRQSEAGSSCMTLSVEVGDPWSRSPKIADVFSAYLNLIRHQRGIYRGALISQDDAKAWRRGAVLFSQSITSSPIQEMVPAFWGTAIPSCPEADWLTMFARAEFTKIEVLPKYKELSGETAEFIERHGLKDSIEWLQSSASTVFSGADFEIDLLPSEDGEECLLALRIHGSFPAREFRELMHDLCDAMLQAGHGKLYNVISIFQRRTSADGSQVVSWYSSSAA